MLRIPAQWGVRQFVGVLSGPFSRAAVFTVADDRLFLCVQLRTDRMWPTGLCWTLPRAAVRDEVRQSLEEGWDYMRAPGMWARR